MNEREYHCEWVSDDPTGTEHHAPHWCGTTTNNPHRTTTHDGTSWWTCPNCGTEREDTP